LPACVKPLETGDDYAGSAKMMNMLAGPAMRASGADAPPPQSSPGAVDARSISRPAWRKAERRIGDERSQLCGVAPASACCNELTWKVALAAVRTHDPHPSSLNIPQSICCLESKPIRSEDTADGCDRGGKPRQDRRRFRRRMSLSDFQAPTGKALKHWLKEILRRRAKTGRHRAAAHGNR